MHRMPYRSAAVVGAFVPLTLSLLALGAWATGFLQLASVRAEYIPMAPSTAIGFLSVSATLIAFVCSPTRVTREAAQGAAGIVVVLAVLELVEFSTGSAALNLEAALVARPGDFGSVPLARMSPLTAIAFLLAGLALAALSSATREALQNAGGILGGVVAAAGGTVALGYAFKAPLLYGGRIIPMALTTGIAFIGTGAALVSAAGPMRLPLRPCCGDSARARLLRVFMPLTVAAVVANGILTHAILSEVHANPALVSAVLALAAAVATGVAVSWMARKIGGDIDRAERMLRESREELELRVRERTADLSAVNRELEAFSYSVSHDLRAPLRHVLGFAALLQQKAIDHLDEENRGYLSNVVRAADRMGKLIDDLLTLSRTSRAALQRQPVKLAALVREAQAEVGPQAAERRVIWRLHDPLPVVNVDSALFRLVLINLFSNALKYSAWQPIAEIEVGTQGVVNGEAIVFVRDNGVGFDMKYAHKLFGVFQRLHREDEFEGTGIGLANVSRIVQRHGGRTWAEGEVGRGATFYIGLPDEGGL
jgi:signal transduction histidine kinase